MYGKGTKPNRNFRYESSCQVNEFSQSVEAVCESER